MEMRTKSICPNCLKERKNEIEFIDSKVFEENGKIWIEKECKIHGKIREIYWSDAELFKKAYNFLTTGRGVSNPFIHTENCPNDCGLCPLHKSGTLLANLDVTNRCNLSCWYCFAHAGSVGYVYEPSFEDIKKMLKVLRDEMPVPCPAVQFSGGEPTIRNDIIEIVKEAAKLEFKQIQIATNGIRIAEEPGFAKKLKEAGLDTIYLKWNGMTEKTNIENLKYKDEILKECRAAKLGIVLVPTLINGFNIDQIGPIIKFAIENIDIIRGVNFQPISFVGRIEKISEEQRKKERFTIPDLINEIEKQLGFIKRDDWYPVPSVMEISKFVEIFKNKPQVQFSAHPACGMATYIFTDENKNIIPITRFLKVNEFLDYLKKINEKPPKSKLEKMYLFTKIIKDINKFIIKEKMPKSFNLGDLLIGVLIKGKREALSKIHWNSLLISAMHFQDAWNFDFERVSRCVIHYVVPDGRIIPFCAYNTFPKYRQEIEKKFSISVEEWKNLHPGKNINDIA
ncbi:MAG: radical SAM protein [Candidatus Aenigmatarchaeota archaeon]